MSAAERAARFVREAPRPDRAEWGTKGFSDFVTEVDREAERLVAGALEEGRPGSVIVGEELTPDYREGELVWIVDPLDGTTNYLHGFPAYAVSIAAVCSGEIVAGAVTDVASEITYSAAVGEGALRGSDRLSVSAVREPTQALIGTGFPFKRLELLGDYVHQLSTLLRSTSGVRRAGAAALDLVSVALGHFDGFWELSLAPWDVAAGTLIVREAGGVVTDLEGSRDVLKHGSIVAGNPSIHSWLMETLA